MMEGRFSFFIPYVESSRSAQCIAHVLNNLLRLFFVWSKIKSDNPAIRETRLDDICITDTAAHADRSIESCVDRSDVRKLSPSIAQDRQRTARDNDPVAVNSKRSTIHPGGRIV